MMREVKGPLSSQIFATVESLLILVSLSQTFDILIKLEESGRGVSLRSKRHCLRSKSASLLGCRSHNEPMSL